MKEWKLFCSANFLALNPPNERQSPIFDPRLNLPLVGDAFGTGEEGIFPAL